MAPVWGQARFLKQPKGKGPRWRDPALRPPHVE